MKMPMDRNKVQYWNEEYVTINGHLFLLLDSKSVEVKMTLETRREWKSMVFRRKARNDEKEKDGTIRRLIVSSFEVDALYVTRRVYPTRWRTFFKTWPKERERENSIVLVSGFKESWLTNRLLPSHSRNRESFSLTGNGDSVTYNGALVDRFHRPSWWH